MLNSVQASNFLKNVLYFEDWELVLQQSKLDFLRKFLRLHLTHVYYHNMAMGAVAREKRGPPNLEAVIKMGLSGVGGTCIELNYFVKLVLSTIGFDVYSIQGSYAAMPIDGNHCMIIVKLTNSELYLIDVAPCMPGADPIPLHGLPCRFMGGGVYHEIRAAANGGYCRYQTGGKLFKMENDEGTKNNEELRITISPEVKTFEDFNVPMKEIYTNCKLSFLLTSPFLFRYIDREDGEENTFVFIWGATLLEGCERSRKMTIYDSLDDIAPVIKKFFPKIPHIEIEKALENFKAYQLGPPGF